MAEGYKDFVAGAVLTAADLEDYCESQGIMRFASAAARDTALSTIKTEGMLAYLKDVNTITVYTGSAWSTIGPVHGAGTSYTPTLTQSGSVSFTINNSTYTRVGRRVWWDFVLQVTGSGTGSNDVTLTVPVTSAYGGNAYAICGGGFIYDSSATSRWTANCVLASTTAIKFGQQGGGGVSTLYLGGASSSFSAGLAVNDIVSGSITYEAAADA